MYAGCINRCDRCAMLTTFFTEILLLYGNALSGSLPKEISQLFNLVELDVSKNKINGSIPERIGDMNALGKSLAASQLLRSNLSFMLNLVFISSYIIDTSTEKLYLEGTAMGETIPDSLYNLTNLKALYLGNNEPGFIGPVKSEIGNLPKLEELFLNDNPLLTGTLPSELGLCRNLSEIFRCYFRTWKSCNYNVILIISFLH